MYSQVEEINDEREKLKIRTFSELMKEISEELTSIFMENEEKEFHDELLAILKSLDEAQDTVRRAYYLFLSRKRNYN